MFRVTLLLYIQNKQNNKKHVVTFRICELGILLITAIDEKLNKKKYGHWLYRESLNRKNIVEVSWKKHNAQIKTSKAPKLNLFTHVW